MSDLADFTKEQLHEQIDTLVAELEGRTSKYKRQRSLVSVLRECSKKIQYETLRAANRRANKYSEEFNVKNRVYECTTCGLWHITTQPPIKKDR